VIELIGSPLHTDAGLHPVRTLLERRCGITRLTDGGERVRLLAAELHSSGLDSASTVPLLAPVLGVGPEHGYHPAAVEGRKLYELIGATVQQYLLGCIGNQAGLVVAEDVHWFDPSTLELLNSLFAASDGRRLMVLTGREGDWLRTEWPVTLFELPPLTDEQSDALIKALDPTVTDAQRIAVRNRSDGVPFYIEHVLGELSAAGPESRVPEALYEPLFATLDHANTDVVRWWRQPLSSGAPVISPCFAPSSAATPKTSTRSSPNSCGRVCSNEPEPTAGDFATSCSGKWRPSCPRHPYAVTCTRALPVRWSMQRRPSNRSGGWSQATSSWHTSTTKPLAPTRRPPSTPGGAAPYKKRWLASRPPSAN
jgi:hypothetical protein